MDPSLIHGFIFYKIPFLFLFLQSQFLFFIRHWVTSDVTQGESKRFREKIRHNVEFHKV